MKLSILLCVTFLGCFLRAQTQHLGLNDVSILLPLPKSMEEMNQFLSPVSHQLLPPSVFKFLPILTPELNQEKNYQNHLKVIAIRFDPCFAEGLSPVGCLSQIRLVWQPIVFKTNPGTGVNTPSTLDTAVHTFYNIASADWKNLLAEVKKISTTDAKAALQIHPTLHAERFDGPYWAELKKIVLKYAGEKNLIRATVMTVRADRVWGFQGVDYNSAEGRWGQIEIPTLKSPNHPSAKIVNQAFFIQPESLLNLMEFKGGVTLMETSNTTWFRFLSDSVKFRDTATEDEIKTAINIAFKLENPGQHNPGTVDCVSCHLAQTVRLWGENNFAKSWDFNKIFKQDQYTNSTMNLTNTSVNPSFVNRMRAFGYFKDEPIVSQRLINETAEIVKNPL